MPYDIDQAATFIHEEAGEEATIIFGAVVDEHITDEIRVTVIATGFNMAPSRKAVTEFNDSSSIVDFVNETTEPVAVGQALREAVGFSFDDIDTRVSGDNRVRQFERPNKGNLNFPTFLRRQAD